VGTRLDVGDAAPGFSLPDAEGRTVALDPAASSATVVVFTANGCPYALAWHDRVESVARDYADRGVRVLQVLSNDETGAPLDTVDGMRERVGRGEVAGPFLRDADQSAARAYGVVATPEVFVIDPSGVVRYHGSPDADHGDPSLDARWLRDALDAVLAGNEVAHPRSAPTGCSLKWRIELLWWEGCPSHHDAAELLAEVLEELGRHEVTVVEREVRTPAEAAELGFPGSPTFQVGRIDLFPSDAAPALGCRVYRKSDGRAAPLPDRADLADAVRTQLARPWDLPGWVDPRRS